jgi:hypothetical protein
VATKREERKQRSEAERQEREHARRASRMRARLFFLAGIVAAAAIVVLAVTHRRENGGRVWSAEHGHWHDKYGKAEGH